MCWFEGDRPRSVRPRNAEREAPAHPIDLKEGGGARLTSYPRIKTLQCRTSMIRKCWDSLGPPNE